MFSLYREGDLYDNILDNSNTHFSSQLPLLWLSDAASSQTINQSAAVFLFVVHV